MLRELLDSTQCQFCAGDRDQVIYGAARGPMPCSWATPSRCTLPPGGAPALTPSHRFGRKLATKAGRLADKPHGLLAAHDTAVQLLGYDDEAECAPDRLPGAALAHRHAR